MRVGRAWRRLCAHASGFKAAVMGVIAFAVLVLILVWQLPAFMVRDDLTPAEAEKAENDARATILQISAGLLLAGC